MGTRFEVRNGKWGAYFHDNHDNVDLTLDQVVDALNSGEIARQQRDGMRRKISEICGGCSTDS